MVHEVLADAREVDLAVDVELGELVAGTDSRAQQDGWTAVGTAGDDDLSSSMEGLACSVR